MLSAPSMACVAFDFFFFRLLFRHTILFFFNSPKLSLSPKGVLLSLFVGSRLSHLQSVHVLASPAIKETHTRERRSSGWRTREKQIVARCVVFNNARKKKNKAHFDFEQNPSCKLVRSVLARRELFRNHKGALNPIERRNADQKTAGSSIFFSISVAAA